MSRAASHRALLLSCTNRTPFRFSDTIKKTNEMVRRVVRCLMPKNSKAEKILAEKMRKVGWKDLEGAGISAGDVDTMRGPKRPLKKGPRKKSR